MAARRSTATASLAFDALGPLLKNILHLHLKDDGVSGSSDGSEPARLPSPGLARIVTRDRSESHPPSTTHDDATTESALALAHAKDRIAQIAKRFLSVSPELQAQLQRQGLSMRSGRRIGMSLKGLMRPNSIVADRPTTPDGLHVKGAHFTSIPAI
jgi:hypothetical protein